MATVVSSQRRYDAWLRKIRKILERDPATVLLHVRGDFAGDATRVEVHRPQRGDASQGCCEQRLAHSVADLECGTVLLEEDCAGRVVAGKRLAIIAEGALPERTDDETVFGERGGGQHELGPVQQAATETLVGEVKYTQGRRHGCCRAAVGQVLVSYAVGDAARGPGGSLHHERRLTGALDEHDRLAGDPRSGGLRDPQRQRDRDGGVDRVASRFEYRDTGRGCFRRGARHDAGKARLVCMAGECRQDHDAREDQFAHGIAPLKRKGP